MNIMIGVFIVLIIMYIGIILFAGATFVKISLFAMDKLVVFIASWYYILYFSTWIYYKWKILFFTSVKS